MKQMAVWKVSESLSRLEEGTLDLEKHLEDWIASEPDLLQNGLTIVGQQISLEAGPLDMLGIDAQGRWVVLELKRGNVDRKTIAQVVDYAACISELSADELRSKVKPYLDRRGLTLDEILDQRGARSSLDPDQREVLLTVVGTGQTPDLDRCVKYLTKKHSIPISVLLFQVFKLPGGPMLLAREVSEQETTPPPKKGGKKLSVKAVLNLGKAHGTADVLQQTVDVATKLGLYVRPYQVSLMIAPPTNKTRVLFAIWAAPEKEKLKTWVGIDPFAEFFGLKRKVVEQHLGSQGWRSMTRTEYRRFLGNLKRLMGTIPQSAGD
jgi:hypothetical protein